jgi:hypothetical protein
MDERITRRDFLKFHAAGIGRNSGSPSQNQDSPAHTDVHRFEELDIVKVEPGLGSVFHPSPPVCRLFTSLRECDRDMEKQTYLIAGFLDLRDCT